MDLRNVCLSEGTARTEDLYPAFMGMLEELDPVRTEKIKEEYSDIIPDIENGFILLDDVIDVWWLMEALFDALDLYSPDGYYFGSHPGDGCAYGWWEYED